MKLLFVVLLTLCVASAVFGDLVCGTDYCRSHPCTTTIAAITCRPPTVYREKHVGKCACCPACVTLLPEGAACKTYSKELGETPARICREPLRCVNSACTAVSRRN